MNNKCKNILKEDKHPVSLNRILYWIAFGSTTKYIERISIL